MKGEKEPSTRKLPSNAFSKTAREWILSSALYDGIEDEDIRQVETLLREKGANPNTLLPEYGIAPFHMVVANESTKFAVQATDICLQHGADPNVRSEDGLTPVHLAAMWGCPEVLHVLLASGGNPWLVDCFNKNAFEYASDEGQDECYGILKTYCGPKVSPHAKSPYNVNLKRVVLYKNDLQIVYEASPSTSQKCASTQTSPTNLSSRDSKVVENRTVLCSKETKPVKDKRNCESVKEESLFSFPRNIQPKTKTSQENKIGTKTCPKLNSRLREVIVNHRRNSTTFEYSPPGRDRGTEESSGVASWRDVSECSGKVSSIVSELVEKLERANKIRQSLKSNDSKSDSLKNVTQRKNVVKVPETSPSGKKLTSLNKHIQPFPSQNSIGFVLNERNNQQSLSKSYSSQIELPQSKIGFKLNRPIVNDSQSIVENSTTNESCQYSPPLNEKAFILNDSIENSTILSRRNRANAATSPVSPPSIGFILDNLDETVPQTRGSSLFSDIDSDVEVCTTPKQDVENVGNIVTEDDSTLERRHGTKYSLSDSLDPYVTCQTGDTREWSSRECFESCMEGLPEGHENSLKPNEEENENSKLYRTVTEISPVNDVSSVRYSMLTNIDDENQSKKTPVNPRLVSSTPERLSEAGSVSGLEKRTWVEATLSSSSSEDDEHVMSISEEYEYTDLDEGVVLIERRYLNNALKVLDKKKGKEKPAVPYSGSEQSEVSTISGSKRAYDTDALRSALRDYGFPPGPINGNTKRVYLRQLKRCRRRPEPLPQAGQPAYSPELLKTLDVSCEHLLYEWAHLEDSMSASFTCGRRQWREGQAKTSFTYLLLDTRLAHDLPARTRSEPHARLWPEFLRSVFYVGKGKRSRPYAHLYKAVAVWHARENSTSKKIQRILDIWRSGEGVVCLHVFMNIIPVEAFTREAAMISALTLSHLSNEKAGEFYGSAVCWSMRLKRRLGCVLLHRAWQVFVAEGERQLRPADID